jgi:hypothetical protein
MAAQDARRTPRPRQARDMTLPPPIVPTGTIADFDFLIGSWSVMHRRLKARLTGSDEWDEFPGTSRCEKRLGGLVNVDENVFPTKGHAGMTMRVFDPAQLRWSIYWVDSRVGVLTPPVIGGFTGDGGEFFGEDRHDGKPVLVQFRWTRLRDDAARWEQAFSIDGESWEWHWVMEFTRAAG